MHVYILLAILCLTSHLYCSDATEKQTIARRSQYAHEDEVRIPIQNPECPCLQCLNQHDPKFTSNIPRREFHIGPCVFAVCAGCLAACMYLCSSNDQPNSLNKED